MRALPRCVLFSRRRRESSLTLAFCRYTGDAPEPRAGLSSGHIPNSRPLPFQSYLSQASDAQPYTAFKPASELHDVLVEAVGGEKKWSRARARGQGARVQLRERDDSRDWLGCE